MAVLWLRFLKEVNEQNAQISEELMENPEIRKAVDICEKAGFSPEELFKYDKYWDAISTEKAVITTSFREGKAEGVAEGKTERNEEVTLDSHKAGLPVATIAAITRLSPEQVTAILKEHGF
jgi:predicted transposase YdaD